MTSLSVTPPHLHNDSAFRSMQVKGSRGEGGGQVLRLSLALASLFNRSLSINEIRAGRSKPGLRKQHCGCVSLVAAYSGLEVLDGCLRVGSESLTLRPGDGLGGGSPNRVVIADAGGAGSTALMLQSILPVFAAFGQAGRELVLKGGTNCSFAPSIDHVELCLLPILEMMGIQVKAETVKRGFSTGEVGEVRVTKLSGGEGCFKRLELGESNGGVESITLVVCGSSIKSEVRRFQNYEELPSQPLRRPNH